MENPAATLISPFGKIWTDLAAQTNAWATIHKLLSQTIELPSRLTKACTDPASGAFPSLLADAQLLATDAIGLFASQHQTIVYPGLVGAWAIVEASFDDLILNVLKSDSKAIEKLSAAGIKITTSQPAGTDEWAEELYRRIENKAKTTSKGYVVEIHRACFSTLGIPLEYPTDRSRAIEELNQVRNCILHHQGIIDNKAAAISPRLAQYLGVPIPPTDPLFSIALHMLHDYTTAWVAALIHSPYLSDALLPGVRNPFSS